MENNNFENNIVKKESLSPVSDAPKIPSQENTKPETKSSFKKKFGFVWEFLKIALIAAIIVLPIRYFLFQPFIVKGESMVPNLQSNDYLIIDEISYKLGSPQRGDIVVFSTNFIPGFSGQRFIKRVIGLPSETVQIKNGKIDILKDGKDLSLDEKKYLPNLKSTDGDMTLTLGPDKYFVLGDNREFSYDSRKWGVLPKEDMIGKAVSRVFPFGQMSLISAPSY